MADTTKSKDDTEKDYLHPEGKPKEKPASAEEKENLAKAAESTELVAEISDEENSSGK